MAWVSNTIQQSLTSDIEQVGDRIAPAYLASPSLMDESVQARALRPQLFSPGQESSTAAPAQAGGITSLAGSSGEPLNTLDESILDTIKRDLLRIAKNLWMVVLPIQDRSTQSVALRNWDLWGPMVRPRPPSRHGPARPSRRVDGRGSMPGPARARRWC